MDSITSILSNRSFDEPPEIENLKKFIKDNYNSEAVITISGKNIVISVNSSGLANSLRLRLPEIKRKLKIEKSLSFRIH